MYYKHRCILQFLNNHRVIFEDKTVLDAGGREGWIIDNIKASVRINLDVNKPSLLKSRTCHKINADLTHIPLRDNCVDLAVFSEVLEHLHNPLKVLRELRRCSHKILVTTPNASFLRQILWFLRNKGSLSSEGHVKEYSRREVNRLFASVGFEPIIETGIGFIMGKRFQKMNSRRFPSKILTLYEAS